MRSFEGGSDQLLSLVWSSYISSPDSFKEHLTVRESVPSDLLFGRETVTFTSLLMSYLDGMGIPCQQAYSQAKGGVHPIVNLGQINTPGFRA